MALDIEITRYTQALHINVIAGAIERKEAYIDIIDVRSVCKSVEDDIVQLVFTDGSQKNLDWNDVSKVDADSGITSRQILFDKLKEWRFPVLTPV